MIKVLTLSATALLLFLSAINIAAQVGTSASPVTKPTNKTPVRTVVRTVTVGRVTSTTGAVSVAAESNANLLLEPVNIRGAEGLSGSVPPGEGILSFSYLKPGRYRIGGTLVGHLSVETEVIVRANQITSVTLVFRPILFSATIITNITNGELKYGVEGQPLDRVTTISDSKAKLELPAGRYVLEIRAVEPGYETRRANLSLTQDQTLDISLERSLLPANRGDSTAEITLPKMGPYYALVIGNNNYQFLPRLKTAENDAQEIARVLQKEYGFETKVILNATRQQIMAALSEFRHRLGDSSNLLIYYAGHGYYDKETEKGYWLPVDATQNDLSNWVIADDVTSSIKAIPAKHILVVSDSCYSGTITRGLELGAVAPSGRSRQLLKLSEGKSRTLLASGGDEPVEDGGGGGHSVFANAFLRALSQSDQAAFTTQEMFVNVISQAVTGRSNQTPEYNVIRNSGHISGDFIFIRSK